MRYLILLIGILQSLLLSAQTAQLVVKNVNVISMQSDAVQYRHDVFIHDGHILKIVPTNTVFISSNDQVIDGTDRFLLPGLSDMHMHFLSDDRIADKYRSSELLVPLKYGVLNGRVPIGNPGLLRDKEKIAPGELLGPSLEVGSPQLAGVNWQPVFSGSLVKTPKQGYEAVRKYKEEGYDFIKLTFGLGNDTYEAIINAGRDFDIAIAGHVPVATGIWKALRSQQNIEHLDQYLDGILLEESPTQTGLSAFGLFKAQSWQTVNFIDSTRLEELIDLTVQSGVWNTPTNHFFISSFARFVPDHELIADPSYSLVSDEVREELLGMRERYWQKSVDATLREKYVALRSLLIREIFRRNKKILAGSDSPEWLNLYGSALHKELINFVEVVGLTPYESLYTATVGPAHYLERDDIGTIQEGKRADLIILDKNPLANIRNIGSVRSVILGGMWLDSAALNKHYQEAKRVISSALLRHEYHR